MENATHISFQNRKLSAILTAIYAQTSLVENMIITTQKAQHTLEKGVIVLGQDVALFEGQT